MQIIRAGAEHLPVVRNISHATIRAVYPHYYPQGTVDFFLAHHEEDRIARDIAEGIVYLLAHNGAFAGTVTLRGREICRLFVLPQYQRRGYGRTLMDFAERTILSRVAEVILDASLPAKAIYLKRGYHIIESHAIPAKYGDRLCYDVMKKG